MRQRLGQGILLERIADDEREITHGRSDSASRLPESILPPTVCPHRSVNHRSQSDMAIVARQALLLHCVARLVVHGDSTTILSANSVPGVPE
jgi:hypothetical protein